MATKKQLSMEGLKPISEQTFKALDAESQGHWHLVGHSNPKVYIPRGFAMVTIPDHPLFGHAVPRASHCGFQTGTGPNCPKGT